MISVTTFTSVLNQLLPEPAASMLSGILFGVKTGIPKYVTDALTATGTLYIVDLSGMKVAILSSLLAKTMGNFFNKRIACGITILCIIGFILFVGPAPGIIRACIMGSLALLATIFGRQKWSLLSFFVALAIMLAVNPAWITSVSFQISLLASLGIILFGGKTGTVRKNPVLAFIENNFRLTLAAQSLTLPLIFFTFQRVSVISPVTELR
jgi:competence protein ComEC